MQPLIRKQDLVRKKLSKDKKNALLKEKLKSIELELEPMNIEFDTYTYPIYQKHIELINKYLSKFTSYIRLAEFSYLKTSLFEKFRIYPIFEVYEEQVVFTNPNINSKLSNARYSMSEGDKSTIALCFFLARLELSNITDKIIVFDDPLSSFDYSRRNATISRLSKIANESLQFILLTHDLGFATDFADKCSFIDQVTLKIEHNGKSSVLHHHNFNSEFLTSTQKDIELIKIFLHNGNITSEFEKREVIRCIRPVLEGVFKSKYFDVIPNNIWLGEIIELIKKSSIESRLFKLKYLVEDTVELNDYTKSYHHSSGNRRDTDIDLQELRHYVELLIKTIDLI